MKGWVYVIANESMPGLVKVGFSTKDPSMRADELNHTGSPLPYKVLYDVLVHEPYQKEQISHRILTKHKEGKEWFRCGVEIAIAAIKQASGNDLIIESYLIGNTQDKVESLNSLAEMTNRWQEHTNNLKTIERLAHENRDSQIRQVNVKYKTILELLVVPKPFWMFWIAGAILVSVGLNILSLSISDKAILWISIIGGAMVGVWLLMPYWEERKPRQYLNEFRRGEEEKRSIFERYEHEMMVLFEKESALTARINAEITVNMPTFGLKITDSPSMMQKSPEELSLLNEDLALLEADFPITAANYKGMQAELLRQSKIIEAHKNYEVANAYTRDKQEKLFQ